MNSGRVVVLGAAGYVGSAVVRELAGRGLSVRAVSRRPPPVPEGAEARVQTWTADLTEPGAMDAAIEDARYVVHAIAHISRGSTWRISEGDREAERVNVGLVRDLVAAMRRVHRAGPPVTVLYAGSVSQAGPSEREVFDGSEPDRPAGEYDRQKLAAERVLLDAHAEGVLCGISLRLPTVFGYGEGAAARDKGVISTMVRKAVAGEPITMWHDGTVRRDLLYVEDVARAFAAAIETPSALAGRSWLLGTGTGEPLGPVFETIARLVAERTGAPPVPVLSVDPPAGSEARDFRSVTVDASGFAAATGWSPRIPLGRALERTVDFCVSERDSGL